MVSMIAIIGKNRELGYKNKLIWNIPEDLKRFGQITKGHPVLMGRKTFESIGHPLPNRANILISSQVGYAPEGVTVVPSVDAALLEAKHHPGSEEVFIIGGATIYTQALDRTDRLYLTLVDASAQADAFFPDYSQFTHIVFEEKHEGHGHIYTYMTLDR